MSKFCPQCGTAMPDGLRFCTSCGHSLSEVPPGPQSGSPAFTPPAARQPAAQAPSRPAPEAPSRPAPQAPSRPAPQGASYAQPQGASRPAARSASYAQPQASACAPPPGRICPRCGTALAYDAVFCDACGASLNGAPPQARPAAAPKKNRTGLIVALAALLLAAVGAALWFFVLRDKEPSDSPAGTDVSGVTGSVEPTGPLGTGETAPPPSDPAGQTVPEGIRLPDGAQLAADAGLNDAAGLWKGQFRFTALEGYESVPGAPDNIDQMVEQLKSTPADMELELETDRSWGINLEGMMPLDVRSVDMMVKDPQTPEEASVHLFKGPDQGLVRIGPITTIEQDESGRFEVRAVVCEDARGELLVGDLLLEMAVQGASVRLTGSFELYREGGQPAVPASEPATAPPTEAPTAPPTEAPTAPPTEKPTDPPAEPPTEKPTESSSGTSAEIPREVEEPEELDFLWIYSMNDPAVLPDGAAELTELSEVLGAWKVLYVFDADGDSVRYLGRLYLEPGQSNLLVRVDPAQVEYGEGWKADASGDYTLEGKLKNGALMSSGPSGNLVIDTFYRHSKWEYAVGEFTMPSGEKGRVYLVRP